MGLDLFCVGKKFLVFNLVARNLKVKYRRSIFGIFWTLLSPLATACVFYFVFKVVLRVQIPRYLLFVLSGMLPWTFFSQTILEGLESIVGNGSLISKVPVPTHIFPFVGTITNLITLFLAMPILLGAAIFSDVQMAAAVAMLPFYLTALFFITYGVTLSAAIAFVYFRDLRHVMSIVMQIWFYSTPVLYDPEMIPDPYRWIVYANPVGALFTGLHQVLSAGTVPAPGYLAATALWALAGLILTMGVGLRFSRGLAERI